MVKIYPPNWKKHTVARVECCDGICPEFVIHPSTAELAEQLVIDSEALRNENYPGIYDAAGDYVPMYCDDPEKIPQGAPIQANSPTGTEPAPESSERNGGSDNTTPNDASNNAQSIKE